MFKRKILGRCVFNCTMEYIACDYDITLGNRSGIIYSYEVKIIHSNTNLFEILFQLNQFVVNHQLSFLLGVHFIYQRTSSFLGMLMHYLLKINHIKGTKGDAYNLFLMRLTEWCTIVRYLKIDKYTNPSSCFIKFQDFHFRQKHHLRLMFQQ